MPADDGLSPEAREHLNAIVADLEAKGALTDARGHRPPSFGDLLKGIGIEAGTPYSLVDQRYVELDEDILLTGEDTVIDGVKRSHVQALEAFILSFAARQPTADDVQLPKGYALELIGPVEVVNDANFLDDSVTIRFKQRYRIVRVAKPDPPSTMEEPRLEARKFKAYVPLSHGLCPECGKPARFNYASSEFPTIFHDDPGDHERCPEIVARAKWFTEQTAGWLAKGISSSPSTVYEDLRYAAELFDRQPYRVDPPPILSPGTFRELMTQIARWRHEGRIPPGRITLGQVCAELIREWASDLRGEPAPEFAGDPTAQMWGTPLVVDPGMAPGAWRFESNGKVLYEGQADE